jgi:hypothetical protein
MQEPCQGDSADGGLQWGRNSTGEFGMEIAVRNSVRSVIPLAMEYSLTIKNSHLNSKVFIAAKAMPAKIVIFLNKLARSLQ